MWSLARMSRSRLLSSLDAYLCPYLEQEKEKDQRRYVTCDNVGLEVDMREEESI